MKPILIKETPQARELRRLVTEMGKHAARLARLGMVNNPYRAASTPRVVPLPPNRAKVR